MTDTTNKDAEATADDKRKRPERDIWSPRKRKLVRWSRALSTRLLWVVGVILFALIYFWPSIFVTIYSGEVGVMYRRFDGGTVTDKPVPEGFYYVPPWDKIHVYNARIQEYHYSMTTLTLEGIAIELEVSVRWRPVYELVGLLHKNVGPDYKEKVIKPEIESALRRIIGSHRVEKIYRDATTVAGRVLERSLEKAQQNYLEIDEVLIRSVKLPEKLQAQITAKMVEKERLETYEFRKRVAEEEVARLKTEAKGVKQYNEIVAKSLKDPNVLQWQSVMATKELAASPNTKTIIIGRQGDGLPLILPISPEN